MSLHAPHDRQRGALDKGSHRTDWPTCSYFNEVVVLPVTFEQLRTTSSGEDLQLLVEHLSKTCTNPAIANALLYVGFLFSPLLSKCFSGHGECGIDVPQNLNASPFLRNFQSWEPSFVRTPKPRSGPPSAPGWSAKEAVGRETVFVISTVAPVTPWLPNQVRVACIKSGVVVCCLLAFVYQYCVSP